MLILQDLGYRSRCGPESCLSFLFILGFSRPINVSSRFTSTPHKGVDFLGHLNIDVYRYICGTLVIMKNMVSMNSLVSVPGGATGARTRISTVSSS